MSVLTLDGTGRPLLLAPHRSATGRWSRRSATRSNALFPVFTRGLTVPQRPIRIVAAARR
jgi:hypothetical protein